jgi:hypothetical protein
MSTFNTPILLLIFNRDDTSEKVLLKIREQKPSRLYIAADGARSSRIGEDILCQNTRDVVLSQIDWKCEVKTLFRDSNLGCKLADSAAITWFFEHEEMGIILEDDCLPDDSFFKYCEELLIKYKDDTSVFSVSGNNFVNVPTPNSESLFFSVHSHIWGWATWRRAWENYDVAMKDWPRLKKTKFLKNLFNSSKEVQFWSDCFDGVYYRNVDTWDYQWMLTCWIRNGLTALPAKNLVQNIGFDERATHTKTDREIPLVSETLNFPLVFPSNVIKNKKYDNALWEKVLKPKSLLARILAKLKI